MERVQGDMGENGFSVGSLLTGLGSAGLDAGKFYLQKKIAGDSPSKATTDRQAQQVAAAPAFNTKWLWYGGIALAVVIVLVILLKK